MIRNENLSKHVFGKVWHFQNTLQNRESTVEKLFWICSMLILKPSIASLWKDKTEKRYFWMHFAAYSEFRQHFLLMNEFYESSWTWWCSTFQCWKKHARVKSLWKSAIVSSIVSLNEVRVKKRRDKIYEVFVSRTHIHNVWNSLKKVSFYNLFPTNKGRTILVS